MNSATSGFAPGSSSTPSQATLTSALNQLCTDSVKSACSETLIRPKITAFYTACPEELTTKRVEEVVRLYDVLYTILPIQISVCAKDDSANWCVLAPSTNSREVDDAVAGGSTPDLTQLLSLLYTDNSALKRRADTAALVPNMTTYHDSNLPFLFFNPNQDATTLCTTCLRNVLTAYINFESDVPYAPGLNQSELLDTQSALYQAVQSKCPSNFLSGAVQAAGGLSSGPGLLSSGAVSTISSEYQSFLAIAMGVATLAVSVVV